MSTRIYVMTHTAFDPPQDPAYIPLHVGRAGKADLGYLGASLMCYLPLPTIQNLALPCRMAFFPSLHRQISPKTTSMPFCKIQILKNTIAHILI